MNSARSNPDATRGAAPARIGTARRTALLTGVAVGAIIIVTIGGYWVYDYLATPAAPNIETGEVSTVVAFIVNPRGLLRLPRVEQDRFLQSWKAHYAADAPHRQLRQHLESLPDDERQALRSAFFQVGKRRFLVDAQEYLRLRNDRARAYPFLVERLSAFAAEAAWLKGNGDPSKDLTGVFGSGLPRNPEDWTKLIVSETTPEERVLGEQYLDALKQVREQERKRQKAATTTAAS